MRLGTLMNEANEKPMFLNRGLYTSIPYTIIQKLEMQRQGMQVRIKLVILGTWSSCAFRPDIYRVSTRLEGLPGVCR